MEIVSRFAINSRQLDKLNGCSVHVVTNIDGELATLGPNPESSSTTMRDMPPFQFYTSTSRSPRSHDGRDVLIRIRDQDRYFVGLRDPSPVVGPVALERIANHDIENDNNEDPRLTVDWEMHADAASSTIRLFLPGTNRQLFPTFVGGNFTIAESNLGESERPGPVRITPLCCPSPAPWPFVADDRTCSFLSICPAPRSYFFINSAIKFTIEFQRTSLARPFFASPAKYKALCSRLQRAFRKINAEITPFSLTSHLNLDANVVPKRNLSSRATDWAKADLPACPSLCHHPTICVGTGDCQCVLFSCLPRARFPFPTFANLPLLSYPPSAPSPSSNTQLGRAGIKKKENHWWEWWEWWSVHHGEIFYAPTRHVSLASTLLSAQIHVAPISESDRLFREQWTDREGNKEV